MSDARSASVGPVRSLPWPNLLIFKERLKNFALVGGCYDLLYVDPMDLSSRGARVPTQTDGSLSRSWRGSSRAPSGPRTWGMGTQASQDVPHRLAAWAV
jgi:hypothetical protein